MIALARLLGFIICAVLGVGLWTQKLAYDYGYAPVLGEPMWQAVTHRRTLRVYAPLKAIEWQWRWGSPRVRFLLGGSVAGVVALGAVGLVVATRRGGGHRSEPPPMEGHGSTQWAQRRDLWRAGLFAKEGWVIGRWGGRVLRYNGEENIAMVGPARSGKGIGPFVSTLLDRTRRHAIIIDIRGETKQHTAGWSATLGRVLTLSLTQPGSDRFSLPQAIRKGTYHEFMDAAMIAEAHVDPSGAKGDRKDFWESTSRSFLTCILLYEVHTRLRPTMAHIASFWSQPGKTAREILEKVVEHAPTQVIAELGQEVLNKTAREASGILSTMMMTLFIYRDPTVAKNTACCDFTLEEFTQTAYWMTLYIVRSAGEEQHTRTFERAFFQLALKRWEEIGQAKHQIDLFMDEVTSLGRMDFFEHDLAHLGGRGIRTLLAVQNTPQIRDTYGHADTLLEQCKVKIFFAPNGPTTGKEIAEQVGMGTATTLQESRRRQGWVWAMDDSRTQQEQQHSRALLTTGEAQEIPPTHEVIKVTGCPPIWARKNRFFNRRVWVHRSRMAYVGGVRDAR